MQREAPTPDAAEMAAIVAGLTKAQRDMLTRPDGRYQDDAADVVALLNAELIGTFYMPLGLAIRQLLQKDQDDVE